VFLKVKKVKLKSLDQQSQGLTSLSDMAELLLAQEMMLNAIFCARRELQIRLRFV
jgi:hypothetical protein